jgi:AcrR family transcriptional regulator
LDLGKVVDAALDLLDRAGPSGLSIRAVAGQLDVNPNAVYTYVPDRAALEREVTERVMAQADLGLLTGPPSAWRNRLLGYASALRTSLLRHPGAVHLFMTAPMDGPTARRVGEDLMGVLHDAGLTPEDATRATYLLIVHVLGAVALEVAETDGRPPLASEADRVAYRSSALAEIDPAYPRTAATAHVMARWISTDQFEWGLDRIIDGLSGSSGGEQV